MKKALLLTIFFAVCVAGCASGQGGLIERGTKRQMVLAAKEKRAYKGVIQVETTAATLAKENIEITATYVNEDYLNNFFNNKDLFGDYAGINPYVPEVMVFYVKIINNSGGKIRFEPKEFTALDDLNSQYMYLSPDDIIDIYAARGSLYGFAKTTGDIAPGIYGAPLRVATLGGGPARKRLFLLNQVVLKGGYLHNGVIYDGYIAFLKPNQAAKTLTLIFPNIKTGFDADDKATKSVDFEFNFSVSFK